QTWFGTPSSSTAQADTPTTGFSHVASSLVMSSYAASTGSALLQCLVDVAEQVGCVFQPDREPDRTVIDPRGEAVGPRHLRVRRRGRVHRQRAGIADIDRVIDQPQCADETRARGIAALQFELQHAAAMAAEVAFH